MVDVRDFLTVSPDGFRTPDFGRIAQVGIGATFGALLTGLTSLVLGIVDVPIALLQGLGDFLARVVFVLVETPGVIVEQGFLAAVPFIIGAGPAGLVVAIAVGLVAAYAFRWVISRV